MSKDTETTCLACHGTYYEWQIAKHEAICPEFKAFMKKQRKHHPASPSDQKETE